MPRSHSVPMTRMVGTLPSEYIYKPNIERELSQECQMASLPSKSANASETMFPTLRDGGQAGFLLSGNGQCPGEGPGHPVESEKEFIA
jgi:hypothetical protein